MAQCSKTRCTNQSADHGNCARCHNSFCVDHKDNLLFFEVSIDVAGYASKTISGMSKAKKKHDKLVEKSMKEWVSNAEKNNLNPRSWGKMKKHKSDWEHKSGVGWYLCESCYNKVATRLDSSRYKKSLDDRTKKGQNKNSCFIATTVYETFREWWKQEGSKVAEATAKAAISGFVVYLATVALSTIAGATILAAGIVQAFGWNGFVMVAFHASFIIFATTYIHGWAYIVLALLHGLFAVIPSLLYLLSTIDSPPPSPGIIVLAFASLTLSIILFVDDLFGRKIVKKLF